MNISGNFQSFEHKNFNILSIKHEKLRLKVAYPTSKLGHTVLCVLYLISRKQSIKHKAKYWSSSAQKIGNFLDF